MIIKANDKVIAAVLKSVDFLNCPTFILNGIFDDLYRQLDKDTAINSIKGILMKFGYNKPDKLAKDFIEWRSNISMKEFREINENPYIDNPPAHVLDILHKQIKWYEDNTTYYPNSDIVNHEPSYPYKPII